MIGGAFLISSLLAPCVTAYAEVDELDAWQAIPDDDLDTQRGGFVTDAGVSISFGIERAVIIGGVIQATQTFDVPGIGGAPSGEMENQVRIVQNGPGNTLALDSLPVGVATLIQNSLDHATIENITIINAAVTNMDFVRLAQVGASLGEQLMRSLH